MFVAPRHEVVVLLGQQEDFWGDNTRRVGYYFSREEITELRVSLEVLEGPRCCTIRDQDVEIGIL